MEGTYRGLLYHLNHQRLECWIPELPLAQQGETFKLHHRALTDALQSVHDEALLLAAAKDENTIEDAASPQTTLSRCLHNQKRAIAQSLLNHWKGLYLFLDNPEVPMDNNSAENAVRGPVIGRKNFFGSGSLWSASLAASLFTLFQTLELWKIPLRPWLGGYLQACADNGGLPPVDITPFLPWSLAGKPQPAKPSPSPISPSIDHSDSS